MTPKTGNFPRKREIFRENEENSLKTDDFVQIEKFPSKKPAVFAVLYTLHVLFI